MKGAEKTSAGGLKAMHDLSAMNMEHIYAGRLRIEGSRIGISEYMSE